MAALTLFVCVLSLAQAPGAQDGPRDWYSHYYQKPAPEKFEEMVRAKVKSGALKKSTNHMPMIGFYSQVMAQNPDKIQGWLNELSDLEEAERGVILMGAWFSDTQTARDYFTEQKLEEYIKEKAPKIEEIVVKDAPTLDMLWGMFLASGEAAPVRRIVSAFDLSKYSGDAEKYKTSAKTEDDRQKAMLDITFQAAMWSVESNCKQHPRVLEHCDAILREFIKEGKEEHKLQAMYLGIVLSKVKPEKYKAKLVEVPAGEDAPKPPEAPAKPK